MLVSEHLTVTMAELDSWSMLDLAHAHLVLDMIEEAQEKALQAARASRRR